ncbi:MAG TPA: ABC transporter ATP-binding protein [Candidatus Paceibacterota bacterium]|nr:ABC transporter ATP-binding protein [Candidatus Paceibacterota bacterium]
MPSQPLEKPKEKTNIGRGARAIWLQVKPFRKLLNWLVLLGFVSAAANGFVPFATGRFFDALIGVSRSGTVSAGPDLPLLGNLSSWAFFLMLWAVTQLIANNVDWLKDRMKRKMSIGVWMNIQAEGFAHMFSLPLRYHKNAHTNGEMHKISTASWRVSDIVDQATNIGPQMLSIAIGLFLSYSISPKLAGVMVAGVLLYLALLVFLLKPIARIDAETNRLWNQSWDDAAASVQQIESVKQAAGEEYEIAKIRRSLLVRTKSLWLRVQHTWSSVEFFQRTVVFFTQLAIFILSVRAVSSGAISVGDLVALNGYSMMFFAPFATLGYSWQNIQNGITSAAQVQDIFDEKAEAYHPADAVHLGQLKGRVVFKGVHFRYGPHQPEVLAGLDLDIQPGQVVALVGESGVGKSTSIHLISGYYFPTAGSVEIDGIDTRRLDLTELRRQIAVVPQEVALFNDSIMANIRYGSFEAGDEAVRAAAKEAHMEEFIATLPEGYGTLVGERGIKLSVGQKQRVAIARAMLRDPRILILDEPTSALDAETERIVTSSLEKLMVGRTTFVIAHRLSTVRKADLILVFQKGRIVEAGSHSELIGRPDGIYRKLHDYQIGLH